MGMIFVRPTGPRRVRAVALTAALALAACTTEDGAFDLGAGADLSAESDLGDVDLLSGPDLACTPEVQSCTGLCGPVHDNCAGITFQCGACPSGKVCDLDEHVCITPKADCAALMKVCGTTKNSCGQTISCTPFTCPGAGDECDPDSNQCVGCKNVSCLDLGYECGMAWLGCGPQSNKTDCGTCGAGLTCNDALHACEPTNGGKCGGKTPKQMCDAAKAAKNVECGIISDGCGGLIDCTSADAANYTCRTGLTCGGQGVPNRCAPFEPPTECLVAGYDCGTLMSACGGTITCGYCDATKMEVCNLASGQTAGTCGPACNMPQKSCAVDYAGMCGKHLANNCWPAIDCDCAGVQVCSTSVQGLTGTCGTAKLCGDYGATGAPAAPCSNSANNTAFPKGDGSYLVCGCTNPGAGQGQESCVGVGADGKGTCCKHPTCQAGDVQIADPCTGGMINCCAPPAIPFAGACCTENACPNDNKYHPAFDRGCGLGTKVCGCGRFGKDDPSPAVDNASCCTPPPACAAGQCAGTTVSVDCASDTRSCAAGCGASSTCMGNNLCCVPSIACPSDGIYRSSFFNGCVNVTCGCPGGTYTPRDAANNPVNGAACCSGPAACGTNCSGVVHHGSCPAPNGGVSVDNTVAPVTCTGCGSLQCCNAGTCQAANANCGNNCPSVTDSCGNVVPCACTGAKTCQGGTCQCPSLPSCGTGCNCTGIDLCKSGTCCTPKSCPADLPGGWQCGIIADTCSGTNISCNPCTGGNKPNAVCNGTSHLCECTPTKCCKDTGGVQPCLAPGPYANDGCGSAGTCSS